MASREHGRVPRPVAVLAAFVAVAVGLALLPPVQAGTKAAGVVGDVLELPVPRPLAPDVTLEATEIRGVAGHLYAPSRQAPPVLLVPGATPAGLRDGRAVRVATAYARAGRTVFMPELDLYEQRFTERDLHALAAAARGLAARPGADGRVVLVGFSYGGSFALIAAADPALEGLVSHVGVFGAYHDLVGVVQAATSGVSLVDGEAIPWEADPAAEDIMRENAIELVPEAQQDALARAFADALAPEELPQEAKAVHTLLTNTDPERTFPLAEDLAPEIRDRLARFSPASVAADLDVPVSILHSTDDPAVPFGEALRLVRDLPDARLYRVELFRHVDFRPEGAGATLAAAGDVWRTWRFASRLLGVQERPLSALAPAPSPRAHARASPAG